MNRLAAALLFGLLAVPAGAADQPVSAFAASVGLKPVSGDPPPAVSVYVVPDGRTFLLTDVLVANHGGEVGPLYLADSQGTRCAIELLQPTVINNGQGMLNTLANAHISFSTGIPFLAGETVTALLPSGTRGVDVTLTGKLLPGLRRTKAVKLPGGDDALPAAGESRSDGGNR